MLLPFTCGIAISFQIFLNIFSNENKTTKLLSGFFVIFFLIICFALIAKFWETPLSMLIAFALLEPLKNKFLLKSYDGDVLTWVLFAASFLILFLSHVIAKILKVDLFEKYNLAKGDYPNVIPNFDVISQIEEVFGISANIPLIKNN